LHDQPGSTSHARRNILSHRTAKIKCYDRLNLPRSRPIAQVARELGIGEGTLGNWVAAYRRDHAGDEPALNISERERLRQLEREARELRMENEFLKKPPRTSPRIIGE
ncbi:transposase, partial [Micromonospora sp. ATA51]|nr:transposase [Micromonospora sp. ATA51]